MNYIPVLQLYHQYKKNLKPIQKLIIILHTILFACFASFTSFARPISYSGGLTLMQTTGAERYGLHLHYSPSVSWSVGYKGEYWTEKQWLLQGVQLNWLLKRWNQSSSQANIYLKFFGGLAFLNFQFFDLSQLKPAPTAFFGLTGDWENRRFYTAYENRFYFVKNTHTFVHQFRAGFAPYLGAYGDLHTFIILEIEYSYDKFKKDQILLIPVLRFFKWDYLAELGMSHKKHIILNLMIRF